MTIRGMRSAGVLAAVMALTVTGAASATAQVSGIDRGVVQAGLDKIAADGATGVQARVTGRGESFTARGGVVEVGGHRPVPTNGHFRIGSITKTFVSTVTLQLVGEGKVGLDTPVSTYLPGLLPDGDAITVRHLLQHTSGLYNYTNAMPLDPAGFETIRFKHYEPRELVAMATSRPLDFPPGTKWNYSNTNYIVIGLLIEQVTGAPYEQAVRDRILRPLHLSHTSLPGDRVTVPHPHAHGYLQPTSPPVDVTALNPSWGWAAGEMISTTADLDRFMSALLQGKLLAPAQLAELTKSLPFTQGYGLGIAEIPLPCGVTVYGHDGGIPGYASVAVSTKDTKTRLELSITTGPVAGEFSGIGEVIDEVFCP
ncbi:D-alanyl-D-alanine carboxypeptidase [Actinokineospora alba]|uniref:D-alanyl-D-alanine carboxypeptidase n=1 Tax=Actinokineospora alba TaxID=504798 RepID=A0A1H0QTD3_9PSEU|nr:serine hydrolase domain-containing protein [Actinokineospora alba]TDP70403.1 D-alanyl-D-alanine carboxypeptidase [Actinokineospora alba]SDI32480.1 D-alanyl-D-alanine carboxypeptidase [Actinokineospora alba]SDP20562.1 D-alanyl-D-alanine carboxypeptidase [Actinokineospora alba]